jgi:hypothetical protein
MPDALHVFSELGRRFAEHAERLRLYVEESRNDLNRQSRVKYIQTERMQIEDLVRLKLRIDELAVGNYVTRLSRTDILG